MKKLFILAITLLWLAPLAFGQGAGAIQAQEIYSPTGQVQVDGLVDKGGQVYNAKAYSSPQSAVTAATSTGGKVLFPPGTYTLSSTLSVQGNVEIECEPGAVINSSAVTGGAAISFTSNNFPGGMTIERGCAFVGPGSTSAGSIAISVGASGQYVSFVRIVDTQIGVHGVSADGYETAITNDSAGYGFGIQVVNPNIQNNGTALRFYGENNQVTGGTVSGNTTSLLVEPFADVTVQGTSMDSDSGVYVQNNGALTINGAHLETNLVALAASGFINNNGSLSMHGGSLIDDLTSGAQAAFITNGASAGNIQVYGTSSYTAGQAVSHIVAGPSSGGINGVLAFQNLNGDDNVPVFDGANPGRLFVIPAANSSLSYSPYIFYNGTLEFGGYNGTFHMATLDAHSLTANETFTMPSATGTLALTDQLAISGPLTTTAATSNAATITGVTASSHCTFSATNSSAAADIANDYISAIAANSVTLTHTATAGMTYDFVCTVN